MDEQKKYEVIKKLVDENGNKDRAALTLGITKRQVYRLIKTYKENILKLILRTSQNCWNVTKVLSCPFPR